MWIRIRIDNHKHTCNLNSHGSKFIESDWPWFREKLPYKDTFVRKAELKLSRSQTGKETVRGGFFTEEEMRTELRLKEPHGCMHTYMCL